MTLSFRLGSYTFALDNGSPVRLVISQNGQRRYSFETSGEKKARMDVVIPPPTEDAPHVAQDIETFDRLLTQYTELSWTFDSPPSSPPPLPARPGRTPNPESNGPLTNIRENVETARPVDNPELRGHLVFMDEANGDIVGELPGTLRIREDPALPKETNASDAVVLEMQPAMYDAYTGQVELGMIGDELREAREIVVHAVPPEEQDWVLKSVTVVRYVYIYSAIWWLMVPMQSSHIGFDVSVTSRNHLCIKLLHCALDTGNA